MTDGFQARWRWKKKKEDKEVMETKMLRGEEEGKRSHIIDVVIDPGKIFLIAAVLKISGLSFTEEEQLKELSISSRKSEFIARKVQLWKKNEEKERKSIVPQEEVENWRNELTKKVYEEWTEDQLKDNERFLLNEEGVFKTKNGRKKWRRKMKKRHALLSNPNFSSYFLSGKEWRFWLNPTEKPKTNRQKREKKKKEREREERKKEKKKQFREEYIRRLMENERREEIEEEKKTRAPRRKRPYPALRLKRFRNHQKAVTNIANDIQEKAKELYHRCFPKKKKETLPPIRLLWGDGSFPHTGNHHPPCPNKGLKESLTPFFSEVLMASEIYTTQASPCCDDASNFNKNGSLIGVKIIDVC